MIISATLGCTSPCPPYGCQKSLDRSGRCMAVVNIYQGYTFDAKEIVVNNNLRKRRCECYDLYKELVPYKQAWSWQKSILERKFALVERDEDDSDFIIILQHPSVYTLGTNSSEEYLNFDIKDAPYDVYRTERGGEVTYHGPGQLVMYPIINLRNHRMDLHWYLRSLEEVVIRVLSSTFSIKASRVEGLTGVWVGNQKIAAIGIRVSRWITYHGLALNVATDLTPFQHIVPCGIRDRQVGSLIKLLGGSDNVGSTKDNVDLTYPSQLMDIAHTSLLKEFSEVFQLNLQYLPLSDLHFAQDKVLN